MIFCALLVAEARPNASLDVFELNIEDLMEMEVTSLSTGTPMQSSKAPGIVTVLYGEDLELAGCQNVLDALALVPGLYVSSSEWTMIYRGLGMAWNSGKILFKLNGVNFTESLSQEFAPILIPIDVVERIEIVRGPGSALYGKGAFLATINVITRENENRVFISAGSFDSLTTGFNINTGMERFRLNFSLFKWDRSDTGRSVESDVFTGTPYEGISYAPGPYDDAKHMPLSGIFKLEYEDFILRAQSLGYDNHIGLGMTGALPPFTGEDAQFYRMNQLEASHKQKLDDDLGGVLRLGYRDYYFEMTGSYFLYPAGYMGLPADMTGGPYYTENTFYASYEANYTGLARHNVLVGAEAERTAIDETWQETNYDPVTYEPLAEPTVFDGEKNWLDENASRTIGSVYAQDIYAATDNMTLTYGARYDNYSDSENMLAPRVALVYNPREGHSLKAQYAKAFRPPTFIELYMRNNPVAEGDSGLYAEKITTYEMGYSVGSEHARAGATVFYSELDDMIDISDGVYANVGEAVSRGVELEIKYKPVKRLNVDGSLSYVDARERGTDDALPGSVNWLGNVVVGYMVSDDLSVSALVAYRGKAHRNADDPDMYLDAVTNVDLSVLLRDALMDGLSIRAAIKNVFDAQGWQEFSGYPDDIEETGRTWWAGLAYIF